MPTMRYKIPPVRGKLPVQKSAPQDKQPQWADSQGLTHTWLKIFREICCQLAPTINIKHMKQRITFFLSNLSCKFCNIILSCSFCLLSVLPWDFITVLFPFQKIGTKTSLISKYLDDKKFFSLKIKQLQGWWPFITFIIYFQSLFKNTD